MSANHVYPLMIIIGLVSVLATIVISLRIKKNRVYKYAPAILVVVLAMIFCLIETILHPGSYIGIVYIVILLIISPAILLSSIIAISFDIYSLYRSTKKR